MKVLHSAPKNQCQAQQVEGNLFIEVNETTRETKNSCQLIYLFFLCRQQFDSGTNAK